MAREKAVPAPPAELFTTSSTPFGLLHRQAQTWVRIESTDAFLMPMGSGRVLTQGPRSFKSEVVSGHLQRKTASLSVCYTTGTQAPGADFNVHPA